MSGPIGVLVDAGTLRKALRGRKTVERVEYYRSIARDELGIELVLFSIEGISSRGNRVTGYAPAAEGWGRIRTAVPKVVHKRVLFRGGAPIRKVKLLHRRGTVFINPPLIQNKADMNATLSADPELRPHLPTTYSYRWDRLSAMLDEGKGVILKPRVGSVGQGIMRLLPAGDGKTQLTTRTSSVLNRSALRRRLRRATGGRRYLVQEYLNLARFEGRPFDLRVPVQRDGTGRWTLPGLVAKVARKHPFLTNAGQGGRVIPGETAIRRAFGDARAGEVIDRVGDLALKVAKAVAGRHPFAADLGLDMGVDVDGKPWLIEVNTRDQRYTFHEAGMHDAFRALYRNPLAFCSHLSATLNAGGTWHPLD